MYHIECSLLEKISHCYWIEHSKHVHIIYRIYFTKFVFKIITGTYDQWLDDIKHSLVLHLTSTLIVKCKNWSYYEVHTTRLNILLLSETTWIDKVVHMNYMWDIYLWLQLSLRRYQNACKLQKVLGMPTYK